MTPNEEKALKLIKDFKGKAHSWQIARELGISPEYARLILQTLQKKEKIKFSGGWAFEKVLKKKTKRPKKVKQKQVKIPLIDLKGMTRELEKVLQKTGYKETEALAATSLPIFMESTGLELNQSANLINEARRSLKMIANNYEK